MCSSVNSSGDALECDRDLIFSEGSKGDRQDIESDFLKFSKDQQITLIDTYLKPMLQRDFITDLPAKGLFQVSEQISYLDASSLCATTQVSYSWRQDIREGYLWKKLIEHMVLTDTFWHSLGERCCWISKLRILSRHVHPCNTRSRKFKGGSDSRSTNSGADLYLNGGSCKGVSGGCQEYLLMDPEYYRYLHLEISVNIKRIQKNWLTGKYVLKKIECHSESSKEFHDFDVRMMRGLFQKISVTVHFNPKLVENERELLMKFSGSHREKNAVVAIKPVALNNLSEFNYH